MACRSFEADAVPIDQRQWRHLSWQAPALGRSGAIAEHPNPASTAGLLSLLWVLLRRQPVDPLQVAGKRKTFICLHAGCTKKLSKTGHMRENLWPAAGTPYQQWTELAFKH